MSLRQRFSMQANTVWMVGHHELNEARTDSDVQDAIAAGNHPNTAKFLGWTSCQGEQSGDFAVFEANLLTKVFQEVSQTNGSGTVPIQFQYSKAVHGPEGPITQRHPPGKQLLKPAAPSLHRRLLKPTRPGPAHEAQTSQDTTFNRPHGPKLNTAS